MNTRADWSRRLALAACMATTALHCYAGTRLVGLRCEHMDNPLGIDAERPRLSWWMESDKRGQRQTAYQVLVSSTPEQLRSGQGDLWDSGKVASDESVEIYYSGQQLKSRERCFWKVRVWDSNGQVLESPPASWEMGLLGAAEWQARWVGRTTDETVSTAPLLRREFTLQAKVRQARVYVSGLGYYELYLNGKRVGDHLLDPGYTRYDRRALYVTYDVTGLLKSGRNALGAILGNGWYNVSNKAAWDFDKAPWRGAPRVLCQLEIELQDGRRVTVGSDTSWKCAASPITYNTIYSGEIYDARLEQPGWNQRGFDDATWAAAVPLGAPEGTLCAQTMPPIRKDRELAPVKISEPAPGIFIFDFGQNLSGNARLQVRGPAGAKVMMKYGERLTDGGRLDQKDIAVHVLRYGSNQLFQTDTYVLKGGGEERWHSRFAYDGFRYVEMTGYPGKPGKSALTAVFFHSDVPVTGHFECSNPLLNRIWDAARWSYLGNLQGIPTDCPHREKNGWTGDAHLAAEQAMFNFFPAAVYNKWLNDIGDEQQPDGKLPGIVPTSGWGYKWGNGPAWDSAFLLIPYYQYVYYGDTENFRRHYDGMKRYVDYLTSRSNEGVVSIGLNDWAPYITKTDAGITDTAYYCVDARIVSLAARVLGKAEDATHYSDLADNIKRAFNAKFYHPDTASYDNGSQTALSCALYQQMVEPGNQERVLRNLVAAVEKTNGHIDTGILGAKYILNTLTENGRTDVAYRIASQKDLPSWGWWIEQGATTLWEDWRGDSSRFHIMYGDIAAWFYKALCGINPDPAAPGFKHFFIKPNPVGDLTFARGEYNSIRGKILSDWKIVKGEFQLKISVPANSTATVSLPCGDAARVREAGRPLERSVGVRFLNSDPAHSVFEVGPGRYSFTAPFAL